MDLVSELRDWIDVEGPGSLAAILDAAADRIEELEERVAIMAVEDEAAAAFDHELREIGVREP